MAKKPAASNNATLPETFEPDALYRVQLCAPADYEGTRLVPAHEHELTGTVAEAIRDKIAHARPV